MFASVKAPSALFSLKMKLYLASTSPRRKAILRRLGLKFSPLSPTFIEPPIALCFNPKRFAVSCALLKAISALRKNRLTSGLVIGVDTVVIIGNRVLGKPANRRDARQMLRLLSDKTHRVVSGIAIVRVPDRKIFTGAESTTVKFRRLSESEITAYLKTAEPFDKAGAYAIQGRAGIFVEKINGCYLNVIGLPVKLLLKLLKRTGWKNSR